MSRKNPKKPVTVHLVDDFDELLRVNLRPKWYVPLRAMWRNIMCFFKFWWQRKTRGFDDRDIWSLDAAVAKFMAPRLRVFRQDLVGKPFKLTDKQWLRTLADMQYYIDSLATGHQYDSNVDELKMKRGQAAFGKYFSELWT